MSELWFRQSIHRRDDETDACPWRSQATRHAITRRNRFWVAHRSHSRCWGLVISGDWHSRAASRTFATLHSSVSVDALPETDFTAKVLLEELPAGQDIF